MKRMSYENFLNNIKERAKKCAGKEGKVYINKVIKTNSCELDGLVILEKGSSVSPTIYLKDFYNEYLEGKSIDVIMDEILSVYYKNRDSFNLQADFFENFSSIKDKIVYKIISRDKNKKLLEEVPHTNILDLAIVYYVIISQIKGRCATALIYNKHLKIWDVTVDDLARESTLNTPRLLKYKLESIGDIIEKDDFFKEEGIDKNFFNKRHNSSMFVLTNESQIFGAACILYKDVLEKFADMIGKDFYILPSSIHEVILLPKNEELDKSKLNNMVRDINSTGVSADEVLSDHIYEYKYNKKELLM